jgi:phosphoribosyl-ATP pyrophosphohydrolase/phosphoribosyl-AMP cyclohydrolase
MNLKKYFVKAPLIPAVIQDYSSMKVLMVAYMNEESLKKTIETGYTWFFSRSRNELWNKGATSGHVQKVISITSDCDDDTLLIQVEQTGSACHTGNETCFYDEAGVADFLKGRTPGCSAITDTEILNGAGEQNGVTDDALQELYQVILERQKSPAENSYTCYLFEKGLDKILKKCGEECSEVIIAAKNEASMEGKQKEQALLDTQNEICDLLYHLTVLMVNEGITLDEINGILRERSRKIGNLKMFHQSNHNS